MIIASMAVLGAVMLSLLSPLALILAGGMLLSGAGFVRQVRLELEQINGKI
ncbi:MAG: hypothetical protein V4723_01345 [Pseudomonadota bacterium]